MGTLRWFSPVPSMLQMKKQGQVSWPRSHREKKTAGTGSPYSNWLHDHLVTGVTVFLDTSQADFTRTSTRIWGSYFCWGYIECPFTVLEAPHSLHRHWGARLRPLWKGQKQILVTLHCTMSSTPHHDACDSHV